MGVKMISLTSDVADLILQRTLAYNTIGLNDCIRRMTGGYKINQAKDNAAGFSIVTDLSTKISSMLQVQQNTADGIALLQTAEGGLEEIENLLRRLRELSVQAANGTYGTQSREAMQKEADEIIEQIEQIRNSMQYNGMSLYEAPNENIGVTRLANSAKVTAGTYNNNTISKIYTPDLPAKTVERGNSLSAAFSSPASAAVQKTQSGQKASAANTIEGVESFAGNETRTITIDGVQYTVKNRLTTVNELTYSKDASSGVLTFQVDNFSITAQKDVAHNVVITGKSTYFTGGDLNDTITADGVVSSWITIYGGSGDDVLNLNNGSYISAFGEDGNDIINSKSNQQEINTNGGSGDDVFNIYAGGNHSGGDGEDTFNVFSTSNGATVNGNAGTNAINDNGY